MLGVVTHICNHEAGQKDHKFPDSLDDRTSSKSAWAMQWDLVSKHQGGGGMAQWYPVYCPASSQTICLCFENCVGAGRTSQCVKVPAGAAKPDNLFDS